MSDNNDNIGPFDNEYYGQPSEQFSKSVEYTADEANVFQDILNPISYETFTEDVVQAYRLFTSYVVPKVMQGIREHYPDGFDTLDTTEKQQIIARFLDASIFTSKDWEKKEIEIPVGQHFSVGGDSVLCSNYSEYMNIMHGTIIGEAMTLHILNALGVSNIVDVLHVDIIKDDKKKRVTLGLRTHQIEEKKDLREVIKPEELSSLDVDEKEKALRDLALTLEELHSWGLIHNDIKPENVIWYRQASDDESNEVRVRLIDFGLSFFDSQLDKKPRYKGNGNSYLDELLDINDNVLRAGTDGYMPDNPFYFNKEIRKSSPTKAKAPVSWKDNYAFYQLRKVIGLPFTTVTYDMLSKGIRDFNNIFRRPN
jgi:serine/threonine protein kinase